jgi:alcohol dehydrogenase
VLAIDPVAGRREAAARLGAEPVHPDEVADDRRVDAVVEAAGPGAAQALAASLVRPGGTLSIVAVQTAPAFGIAPVLAYDRNLTIRAGRAPVRAVLDRLLPRLADGRLSAPTDEVVTHPDLPLEDGPGAYRRFAVREPGMIKVTFRP